MLVLAVGDGRLARFAGDFLSDLGFPVTVGDGTGTGIRLDLRRGRSLRAGPRLFDFRRALLADIGTTRAALGLVGEDDPARKRSSDESFGDVIPS